MRPATAPAGLRGDLSRGVRCLDWRARTHAVSGQPAVGRQHPALYRCVQKCWRRRGAGANRSLRCRRRERRCRLASRIARGREADRRLSPWRRNRCGGGFRPKTSLRRALAPRGGDRGQPGHRRRTDRRPSRGVRVRQLPAGNGLPWESSSRRGHQDPRTVRQGGQTAVLAKLGADRKRINRRVTPTNPGVTRDFMIAASEPAETTRHPGSRLEVFAHLPAAGLDLVRGPIAHLGNYRSEFVARRKWLDEASFADIVALWQFLPGPASSQVAISIGMLRAGLAGGSRRGSASRCHRRCQ